jgi:hypothetical protein
VGTLYKALTDSKGNQAITSLQAVLRQFGFFYPKAQNDHEYRLYAAALLRDLLNAGLEAPPALRRKLNGVW